MPKMDLSKYGIKSVKEVLYNPTYEVLYNEETKPELEGYEKGQVTELGAINVMTGIYTGRSPKDKYIVMDKNSKETVWWNTPEYPNDNHPMSEKVWKVVKKTAQQELSGKRLFVVDGFCGTHKDTRMKVRFIMENIPFFISPPYQVLRITCSLLLTLKATQVSLRSPSSSKLATLAFEAQ